MTILIVLLGLLASHFLPSIRRWRQYNWLLWPMGRITGSPAAPGWAAPMTLLLVAVIVALIAGALFTALLGRVGWIVPALAAFLYTLGPRDLDRDVSALLEQPQHADGREAATALGVRPDQSAPQAASAVLYAACTRWFAVVFWFAVLGVAGVLAYRLCHRAMQSDSISAEALDGLARLRWVLEWPVLVLMVVTAGLCADLDRVYQAWLRHAGQRPAWLIDPRMLGLIAEALMADAVEIPVGVRRGHQLAWRMLVLWLVVMSLLLLAGWLV